MFVDPGKLFLTNSLNGLIDAGGDAGGSKPISGDSIGDGGNNGTLPPDIEEGINGIDVFGNTY